MLKRLYILAFLFLPVSFYQLPLHAQVGEHRSDWAVGVNGGYALTKISFVPKVPQSMLGGITIGVTGRYVCEKYFSSICSIQAELNYTQTGWKEKIQSENNEPVINNVTGLPEEYTRNLGYLQFPVFAHLAWGREKKGVNFFFQAGPQIGYKFTESTKTNFAYEDALDTDPTRAGKVIAQDSMSVQNSFDYGIAAGAGMEISIPKAGHLQLEGRYYYGLGNIYGDSKKDYFSRSNFGTIYIKLAWLFDIK